MQITKKIIQSTKVLLSINITPIVIGNQEDRAYHQEDRADHQQDPANHQMSKSSFKSNQTKVEPVRSTLQLLVIHFSQKRL